MWNAGRAGSEARLEALRHEVADIRAEEMRGLATHPMTSRSQQSRATATYHALAGPAADLEAVAAPAHVAARGDHLAIVRPRDASGVAGQKKSAPFITR